MPTQGKPPVPVPPLTVYGMSQSLFTRKVTGYLDYKALPWHLRPGLGMDAEVREAGWTGGIPAVIDADGTVMWDSTSLILHFEQHYPDGAVLPQDPVLRFLAHLLDDFHDEWFYRTAVGSRWLLEENHRYGSWDLARDGAREVPMPVDDVRKMVTAAMTGCLPRLGVTPENIQAWISESVRPWVSAFSNHVGDEGYLFGKRPSLADFAFYGTHAAHFVNDPECWRLCEEAGPALISHTRRLTIPTEQAFGGWLAAGQIPDTLFDLLREAGRQYLPWVAEATVKGSAIVEFESGSTAEIATTNFLTAARGVMLARYVEARSPALDEVLDGAGILSFYADHVEQATSIPDPIAPPHPDDNQPYPISPS